MANNKNDNNDSIFSWIFTAIMLSACFPVGVILLIANLRNAGLLPRIGNALKSIFSGSKKAMNQAHEPKAIPVQRSSRVSRELDNIKPARIKKVSRGQGWLKAVGIFCILLGLVNLGDLPYYTWGLFDFIWQALKGVALGAGGTGMLYASRRMKKKERLYSQYQAMTHGEDLIPIGRFASATGSDSMKTMADLEDMLDRGYFGSYGYVERSSGYLVLSPDVTPEPVKKPEPKKVTAPEAEGPYEEALRDIRTVSATFRDPEMIEYSRRILSATASIFNVVHEKPEKQGQIRKFMSYYLPTARKLMHTYARFENQTIEGENRTKALNEIEGSMMTLAAAIEKQLDALFYEEVLDLSGELSVLDTMLQQDGFGDDGFTMKN